ncbi:MAG: histone deacetylase [Planctomycetes bacterium]|nr:histone deacetylase [Planctomycetota bacterium]
MPATFIHSQKYDFKLLGFEKLHPFDSSKFSKAWKLFSHESEKMGYNHLTPNETISDKVLKLAHTSEYLQSLKKSKTVSRIIEINPARFVPNFILQQQLLKPMKYACQGTILATEAALNDGMAMNIGGGFHHAFSDHGEGFCVFADAALSILHARKSHLLKSDDSIIMIDLDAHRGNGFESFFLDDPTIKLFDMYNAQAYPGHHEGPENNFPYMIPLKLGTSGRTYLKILDDTLSPFLDSAADAKIAFYNAGTDILAKDAIGGLNVIYNEVLLRDRIVIDALRKRQIPTVVITSGGYTADSYKLIAALAEYIRLS